MPPISKSDFPYPLRNVSGVLPPPANSLIGDESATVSGYAATSFLIPGNTTTQLIPGLFGGSLGLDFSATTAYGFQIFSVPSGANNTARQILVCSTYTVVWSGNTSGTRSVWLQVFRANGTLYPARYAQSKIEGTASGNIMVGTAVLGLLPGEFAGYFVENTSNSAVSVIGGDITTIPNVTKFQTFLLN